MHESPRLSDPLILRGLTIRNRVFLAPMSGITDFPFRRRAYEHGAGLVVSEMVASGELAKGRDESRRRIRHTGEDIHVVQLAGREAANMAEGARIAAAEGADIIDINMGCPAKKVTGGYAGSALMRDLDHAEALIEAVVRAVDVPVTVKMRLGWDEAALNAPSLARRAEAAGVAMITVHGRTRCQFYEGRADWRAIRRVKEAVSIPVVANGDVAGLADAKEVLEQSGADAVMVGRAGYGAPWTAGRIVRMAEGCKRSSEPATASALADYVIGHYEDMLAFYGVESGLRQARKHLGWYFDKHAPSTDPDLRSAVMRSLDPRDVKDALRRAFFAASELRGAA
jgi:nifR3 family TIM-barrel protein